MASLSKLTDSSLGVVPTWWRRLSLFLQQLFGRPVSATGTTITLLFLLLAIIGPLIAPYDANEIIPADARQAPSAVHWFGTDNLGRDVFSRVLLGAREILVLAGFGTLLAVVVGTF